MFNLTMQKKFCACGHKLGSANRSGICRDCQRKNIFEAAPRFCKCGARVHSRNATGCCIQCRQVKAPPRRAVETTTAAMTRICLKHGGPFLSAGPHNRICDACKHSDEWRAGSPGDYSRGYQKGQAGQTGSWH